MDNSKESYFDVQKELDDVLNDTNMEKANLEKGSLTLSMVPISELHAKDVVVVSCPQRLRVEQAAILRTSVKEVFPKCQIMILSEGMTIDIYRKALLAEENLKIDSD